LKHALAQLKMIRRSIPAVMPVIEGVVNQYHQALTQADKSGLDMSGYRIPPSQIERKPVSFDAAGRATKFSTWRYVDQALFMAHLDAAVVRLASLLPERRGSQPGR
jgi:hypothetical protein